MLLGYMHAINFYAHFHGAVEHFQGEDRLALIVMVCTGPYFLFFCRGFKLVKCLTT